MNVPGSEFLVPSCGGFSRIELQTEVSSWLERRPAGLVPGGVILLLNTSRSRRALPPHPSPLPQGEGVDRLCDRLPRQPPDVRMRSAPGTAPPFSLSPRERAGVRGNQASARSACPERELLPRLLEVRV